MPLANLYSLSRARSQPAAGRTFKVASLAAATFLPSRRALWAPAAAAQEEGAPGSPSPVQPRWPLVGSGQGGSYFQKSTFQKSSQQGYTKMATKGKTMEP